MVREFEIRREDELPATPEQVWEAVATGPGNLGWLYPVEIKLREGRAISRGPAMVTVWDPPRRFACHHENEDGFSGALEYLIEAPDGGSTILRTVIRWAHSGIVDDGWETRTDAANKHTDFYHHTLEQYLRYFSGRPATYVQVQQSAVTEADAFTVLRRGLGLTDDVAEGDAVRLALPGPDPLDAVVDYLTPHFIGLRTTDGLYRFSVGNAWGWPICVGHHLFADDADQDKAEHAWRVWLDGVFA